MRGIAASLIIIFHMVHILKISPPSHVDLIKNYFGLGVPLFFSLSGFVLSYGYRNKLGDIERIIQFYIRRFYRIAPLFYFSLLVWLTLNILFLGTKPDLQTFILNITFLFGLVPGAHESLVWAGWSIGIEMLFYAIFPLLLGICHNIRNTAIGWTLAIIVSSSYYKALIGAGMDSYAYMSIFQQMPFFLSGILAYRIWEKVRFHENIRTGLFLHATWITGSYTLIGNEGLYVKLWSLGFGRLEHNIWSLVFLTLILAVVISRSAILKSSLFINAGKVSYSMYLLHPILMFICIQILGQDYFEKNMPNMSMTGFILSSIATITIVFAASNVSFNFIEKPFMNYSKRFKPK